MQKNESDASKKDVSRKENTKERKNNVESKKNAFRFIRKKRSTFV